MKEVLVNYRDGESLKTDPPLMAKYSKTPSGLLKTLKEVTDIMIGSHYYTYEYSVYEVAAEEDNLDVLTIFLIGSN